MSGAAQKNTDSVDAAQVAAFRARYLKKAGTGATGAEKPKPKPKPEKKRVSVQEAAQPTAKRRKRESAAERRVRKSTERDVDVDEKLTRKTAAQLSAVKNIKKNKKTARKSTTAPQRSAAAAAPADADDGTESLSDELPVRSINQNYDRARALQSELVRSAPDRAKKIGVEQNGLASKTKRWLNVDEGGTMRELEAVERAKMLEKGEQNTQHMVHKASEAAVKRYKAIHRDKRRQWQEGIDDTKLERMLQQNESDQFATSIAAEFREHQSALRTLNGSVPTARRTSRPSARHTKQRMQEASDTVGSNGDGDGDDDDVEIVDAYTDAEDDSVDENPLIQHRASLVKPKKTGSELNVLDEPLQGGVSGAGSWLRKYTATRNLSPDETMQRFDEWLRADIVKTLENQFRYQMLSVAASDSAFGNEHVSGGGGAGVGGGVTMNEMATHYLKRLRSGNEADDIDEQEFLRYVTLAQESHEEVPEDMMNAAASKFCGWEERAERELIDRGGQLTPDQVDEQLSYQLEPRHHLLLKHAVDAYGGTSNDWSTVDERARQETKLSERIRSEEAKEARRRRKAGESVEEVNENLEGADALYVSNVFPTKVVHARVAAELEEIGVEYVQQFLRKGIGAEFGERDCVNGEKCMCLVMATKFPDPVDLRSKSAGFIGREFLLPSELAQFHESRKLPPYRKMCLICNRYETNYRVFQNIERGHEPESHVQDHMYKVDVAGGYCSEQCVQLISDRKMTGIIAPFLRFSTNNYVYDSVTIGSQRLPCYVESPALHFREASGTTVI